MSPCAAVRAAGLEKTVINIGINPNTWALDDVPELKNFSSLDQCLAETRLAGYSGTELGGTFPRTSSELKPRLSAHGLSLIAGWHDGRLYAREVEEEFDLALPHLSMLREMGSACVVYADCTGETFSDPAKPMSTRPRLMPGEWKGYGRKLTQLAQKMADFGVAMAFHHHIGTIVESDGDVDALMTHTGASVGLLLDTGHAILAGGDPVSLAERHSDRISHFHGKDARESILRQALEADSSFIRAVMEGVFTVPGDGMIDYGAILSALNKAGYAGWLVVEAEQDLRKAHPLTCAKLGFANLSRLAAAAGFTVGA
jgi:inosose dehydratase